MCVAFFAACLAVWPVSCINVSEEKGQNHYQSAKARTDTLIRREQKIMFTITRNLHLWHWIENVRALASDALLTLTLNMTQSQML